MDNMDQTQPKWLITVSVNIPYPKTFTYREGGSNVGVGIGRAYRRFRKELKGKRLKDGKITWIAI